MLSAALLIGSFLLCAAVGLFGRRRDAESPFPGSTFPSTLDQSYLWCFLVGFVLCLLFSTFAADTATEQANENSPHGLQLLLALVFQSILYLPLMVRWLLLPRRPHERPDVGQAIAWVALGLGAILIPSGMLDIVHFSDWIQELTGCPENQDVVEMLQGGDAHDKLLIALAAIIMAPLGEECCFRGFLYNILRQRAGVLPCALAVGLFFGAIHFSLVQFLPLTIFGVVQCLAYERAKSLWLPITIHAIFNSLSCVYILWLS